MIFESINKTEHEEVVFCHNKDAGLKAIIAIHNTVLGPALGGTRMWNYTSEQDALNDVLRLSRGMTYKAAVSGLNLGGGKAVIIGKRDSKFVVLHARRGCFQPCAKTELIPVLWSHHDDLRSLHKQHP